MNSAVLFDLDDTLFDHRYTARCVLTYLRERHSALRRFPLDVLEREDFRLLQEKHQLVLAGALSIDEARRVRMRALFEFCGESLTDRQVLDAAAQRQAVYREFRRPVPGALALLDAVRCHAKVGVVTNNMTKEQRGKLDACGLTSLVHVMVTSEEIGYAKPSPIIFQAALDRLDCTASNAVMLGDSWEVDVVGALNSRIRAVWFNRGAAPNPDPAVVPDVRSLEPTDQVLPLLLRMGT